MMSGGKLEQSDAMNENKQKVQENWNKLNMLLDSDTNQPYVGWYQWLKEWLGKPDWKQSQKPKFHTSANVFAKIDYFWTVIDFC